jgi:TonB family protein
VSSLVAASPELKRLWIRVLKRVHPDLAVDEQDRRRCERLTQQANEAYARRDELALRAVLDPKGPLPQRYPPPYAWEARAQAQQPTPAQPTYQTPLVQQPPPVTGREVLGILWGAGAVLCLLLYGIFAALSEEVGRITSLSFLLLLTAAVLWFITKHSKLSYNQKARWAAAVGSGMMLVAICLLGTRPRANSLIPSARSAPTQAVAPVAWKAGDNAPPSQWYWNVIKTRVGQSWNPSSVVETPAGATADVTFTIAQDGSPRDVQLNRSSGYPSLDSSCVLAVQQVRTFGPPEGGAKQSLHVLYPCSYNELESMYAHPAQRKTPEETATVMPVRPEPVKGPGSQLGGYTEAAKNKVAQNLNLSEVAGSTPAGATVYIQFAIRRAGNHDVPTVETSSGYSSLDVSCLGAVNRIQTFGHLPKVYNGDSLTVLYHCTYPGSPTTKSAQDSNLPPGEQPPPSGPVDGVHGAQQPSN